MNDHGGEAARLDINHPDHTGGCEWRAGGTVILLICTVGWILFSAIDIPWLPWVIKLLLPVGIAIAVGIFFIWGIGKRAN